MPDSTPRLTSYDDNRTGTTSNSNMNEAHLKVWDSHSYGQSSQYLFSTAKRRIRLRLIDFRIDGRVCSRDRIVRKDLASEI